MTFAVEGVRIPDSKLAREITELIRDTEPRSARCNNRQIRRYLSARPVRQRSRRCGLQRLESRPPQTADYADFTGNEWKTKREHRKRRTVPARLWSGVVRSLRVAVAALP
jgi:hypothetical protein